jgi:molybdenum cofactor cytidylyltransferase
MGIERPPIRAVGLILAAGRATRFGSPKVAASLDDRPLVRHVIDAAVLASLERVVIVVGPDDALDGLDLGPARLVRNPRPDDGLASSLRIGMDAVDGEPDAEVVVVLLADQPRVRPDVVARLVGAALADPARPIAVPRYDDSSNPNPVALARPAWRLAAEVSGDRGLGPLIAAHPELVVEIEAAGINPDVDRPEDLAALQEAEAGEPASSPTDLAAAWAARVRENRDQVDRFREVPDGADFYGPVSSLFRADPRRTDDQVLDALLALARPDDTWLDIGAGAGRYALPLAVHVREVIALDPSPSMLAGLRELMSEFGIANVRPVEGRWPPDAALAALLGPTPLADVALMAHVGYDIEEIEPFVDAMERATRRLCVAVFMERQPSSVADRFWPPVHGEDRVSLPALGEFVALLRAEGRVPSVTMLEREPRRFESAVELEGFLRRQLWVAEGSPKDARFREALAREIDDRDGRFGLRELGAMRVGVVTWMKDSGRR